MGERALKLMVVLLSGLNAAIWFYYTESTMMAILWAGTALVACEAAGPHSDDGLDCRS